MIKQFIFQTLLRCKYHVGFSHKRHWLRKYFWRLESARQFAMTLDGKSIVWRKDHKKMYQTNNSIDLSFHEDAKNFSTNI
jgi:hypothetical protein